MMVNEINIAGGVRLFLVRENQAPVSVKVRRQNPFRSPFSGCSFQPGNRPGCSSVAAVFERGEKLAESVKHLGGYASGVPIFVELLLRNRRLLARRTSGYSRLKVGCSEESLPCTLKSGSEDIRS